MTISHRPGWHSFEDLLRKYARRMPEGSHYLEWGPGFSTQTVLEELKNPDRIWSVEHHPKWWEQFKSMAGQGLCVPTVDPRYLHPFPGQKFWLILVDGWRKKRQNCMEAVLEHNMLSPEGFLMLHDAHREMYQDAIRLFEEVERDDYYLGKKLVRTIVLRTK